MKIVSAAAILYVSLVSSVFAENTGQARIDAAFSLLEAMELESQLSETIERMVDVEVQNNPGLAPYRHVLLKFYNKYIGYESSKHETAELYANAFTLGEIEELTAFYNTSLGKKVMRKTPELVQKGSQMGMTAVRDNIFELQEMIKDEALKIQKLQETGVSDS